MAENQNRNHGIISIAGANLCVRPNNDNGQNNNGQTQGSAPTIEIIVKNRGQIIGEITRNW